MIYVMSDIHGNIMNWRAILSKINLQKEDHLYILGDVIDRYSSGIEILLEIMNRPNIHLLLGNHELMMYQSRKYNDWESECIWYANGGDVTAIGLKKCSKLEQEEILDFIAHLPLEFDIEVNGKKFLLVHGKPLSKNSRKFIKKDSVFDEALAEETVWERINPNLDKPVKDRIVVFGHTPTCHYQMNLPFEIYKTDNWIGIDCGSGFNASDGGRLACLRLDDMKEFYSHD